MQQRGLAGSDLAGEQHEALAGLHAVEQRREAFAVRLAEIEEGRIRRHLEGRPHQAVELGVHGGTTVPARPGRHGRRCAPGGAAPGVSGGGAPAGAATAGGAATPSSATAPRDTPFTQT